ncbi:MAG: hypothetical protein VXZ40_04290 [Nanoarchaeota archaeon]|nr:hypothetical protein [Nanoarchaeota archaeon]
MENKNLIRISMFIFILFSLFTLGFSHDGEDHSINQNVGNPISPFTYFAQGDNVTGVFVVIFWCLILKGIFELTLMVLAKHIKIEEKK